MNENSSIVEEYRSNENKNKLYYFSLKEGNQLIIFFESKNITTLFNCIIMENTNNWIKLPTHSFH